MDAIVRKTLESRIDRVKVLSRMIAYFCLRNPRKSDALKKELATNQRLIKRHESETEKETR